MTDFAEAIRARKRVKIYYEPGERVIEPHCYGIGSNGQLLLRAFQVSGASASGEHAEWKLFRLDRMGPANDNGDEFNGPRPGYKRGDKAMKRKIIEEL